MMEKKLMKGNEALAEGAIRGGCRFFAGYPITPQNEILEYMSWRQDEVSGTFIQSESEIAGINMVLGAAAAGARAMTSSAGPGFSLKQEGISYIAASDLPAVIVDVQRYGSGLGLISPGQSDYNQAVKGGGHGDYRTIVLAPSSVQESADIAYEAFELAEKYLVPVIILSDGAIGQMAEDVLLPVPKEYDIDSRDGTLKGTDYGPITVIWANSQTALFNGSDYKAFLEKKYDPIVELEQKWESYQTEDAEVVLVAYGISARICKNAVNMAREVGVKAGMIRPISLWPFPKKAFTALPDSVKRFVSVEMSAYPQLADDVRLNAISGIPVSPITTAFNIPSEAMILDALNEAEGM